MALGTEMAKSLGALQALRNSLQVWRSEQEKYYLQYVFNTKPNPVHPHILPVPVR
jgi:hypothetical protein